MKKIILWGLLFLGGNLFAADASSRPSNILNHVMENGSKFVLEEVQCDSLHSLYGFLSQELNGLFRGNRIRLVLAFNMHGLSIRKNKSSNWIIYKEQYIQLPASVVEVVHVPDHTIVIIS